MQSWFSQNLEQDLERICVKKLTRSCNNLVSRIPARILPRILEEIQGRNFDEKPGGDLGEILGRKSCQERKKNLDGNRFGDFTKILGNPGMNVKGNSRGDLITISCQQSCVNLVSGSQDLVQSFLRNLTWTVHRAVFSEKKWVFWPQMFATQLFFKPYFNHLPLYTEFNYKSSPLHSKGGL